VARTFNAGYYCRQFPSCVEQEIADLEFSRRDMYVANELSSGRLFVTILGPRRVSVNGRSEPERFSCPVWWIVGVRCHQVANDECVAVCPCDLKDQSSKFQAHSNHAKISGHALK